MRVQGSGLTETDIVNRTGLSSRRVKEILRLGQTPDVNELHLLARALSCKAMDLLSN